ncbi:RNA methylase [Tenacibaculum larymnensis]|uniref:RNA methylase n=1 Tax=Tenacibaculum larymnensis TaxID=2878201 RepID=A0A9X4EM19_9FLAO|nr:RNA methylase [Tenacibaculum larymnensis]MDE1205503.1 RNA methylase [Tenacibaculum larymnensis]
MNNEKNSETWKKLYQNSQELTKPTSIDNILSDDDVIFLKQELKNIINRFLDKGELHKGIKVYINHELQNGIAEEMAANRPEENETIEQWCMKLFGDQKFGVVFNSLETFSNEFTERMCHIVAPLLQKAGMPLGGLSFLFFMGNYGFTPFGIHKDAKGEDGFLFHLGPNDKGFYTWDIEEYNQIEHHTKVFHEVEAMLPTSTKYPLKEKSTMFIPHQVYHIAKTDEFSLSVVMDYINPSRDYLEKTIAAQIAASELTKNPKVGYLSPVDITTEELDWNNLLNPKTWENKYKNALTKYITKLKSNAGVLQPSIVENKEGLPNPPFQIKGKTIFPLLLHTENTEKTCIMARGNEVIVSNNSQLNTIIKKLNTGETISFDELQNHLTPTWELMDVFDFVSQLTRVGAITICKE